MVNCGGEGAQRPGLDQGLCHRTAPDANNNNTRVAGTEEKYGLRPRTIVKRLQQEHGRQEVHKTQSRPKSRPAPLSKYRRKTANARERQRMKEINIAFETLRKILPDGVEVDASSSTKTKITTLRLAVDYIRALSDVLGDGSFQTPGQPNLHQTQDSRDQTCQLQTHTTSTFLPHTASSFLPQTPTLLTCYSTSSHIATSTSPSATRDSLSSGSDFEDLLSDDSCLLEDNFDVFYDIPSLPLSEPLDILLEEKDVLGFTAELYN
ncbi:hypothetical protein Pcinc_030189 [Petrolisthes cinctipes]|uniref:BHLH domain-containing protein n=1 Tax=Petrolisthes cinctipes TaxID=88211 RepID=A0AAE1K2Y3_PETCI|nr:hypothetical protein Pcinc_042770 [Petrolisthes cinctipes]KAK3864096.1 hypothetical protein Pcinc_030189 [Petrolisthes cinctipes]